VTTTLKKLFKEKGSPQPIFVTSPRIIGGGEGEAQVEEQFFDHICFPTKPTEKIMNTTKFV